MQLLRDLFDSRIFNYGDYNVVYAQSSGSADPWLVGYRRQPLELVLCPVPLDHLGEESLERLRPSTDDAMVNLSNLATIADTGTGYQVETVTGFRTWFEVTDSPRVPIPCEQFPEDDHDDGLVPIDQPLDAEDFHEFMTMLMDALEDYYPEAQTAAHSGR